MVFLMQTEVGWLFIVIRILKRSDVFYIVVEFFIKIISTWQIILIKGNKVLPVIGDL